jgi:hypothetical protein
LGFGVTWLYCAGICTIGTAITNGTTSGIADHFSPTPITGWQRWTILRRPAQHIVFADLLVRAAGLGLGVAGLCLTRIDTIGTAITDLTAIIILYYLATTPIAILGWRTSIGPAQPIVLADLLVRAAGLGLGVAGICLTRIDAIGAAITHATASVISEHLASAPIA